MSSRYASGAATGVPNCTPIVAAVASTATRSDAIEGTTRATSHTDRAALAETRTFSGLRLTPAPSATTNANSRLGSTRSGTGGPIRPAVAVSRPPCPGTSHTIRPTAMPADVNTIAIHQRASPGNPNARGRLP
ncbi:hypothetical protein ACFTSD_22940 [Nocardiaceae bacterium NPDC056970]